MVKYFVKVQVRLFLGQSKKVSSEVDVDGVRVKAFLPIVDKYDDALKIAQNDEDLIVPIEYKENTE